MKKLSLILTVLAFAVSANAGLIADWDSFGTNMGGSPASTTVAATTLGANVQSATLGIVDLNWASANNSFNTNGWTTGSPYMYLAIVMEDGYMLDLSGYHGGMRASGTGPDTVSFEAWSGGNKIADLTTNYDVSDAGFHNVTWDWTGAEVSEVTALEIRIFGSGASSGTGTFRLGDHYDGSTFTNTTLSGNVSVVPEPATLAILGFGALTMLRRRK